MLSFGSLVGLGGRGSQFLTSETEKEDPWRSVRLKPLPRGVIAAKLPFFAEETPRDSPPLPRLPPLRDSPKPPPPPKPKPPPAPSPENPLIWTELFRAAHSRDILGNSRASEKLQKWVQRRANGQHNPQNPIAVLLSGPPGTGKTTIAHNLLRESGLGVLEINASELRQKEAIADKIQITRRKSLETNSFVGLILDEIDGAIMEDDGGGAIQAVRDFIAKKHDFVAPIICICNDMSNKKLRALAKECLDIRFYKLHDSVIHDLANKINRQTCARFPKDMLEAIVRTAQGDARRLINLLYLAPRNFHQLAQSTRDAFSDVFNGAKLILNARDSKHFVYSMRLYSQDTSATTLLLHENYLDSCKPNDFETVQTQIDHLGDVDMLEHGWNASAWDPYEYAEAIGSLSTIITGEKRGQTENVRWSSYFEQQAKARLKQSEVISFRAEHRNHPGGAIDMQYLQIGLRTTIDDYATYEWDKHRVPEDPKEEEGH